ncbi:hypothetical protein [Leptolyngbya sp. PCC 6406]|uniref:ribonuclease toxin HepT-like protein n=1 Tax=Leptolyngbya sp. PCC 6406 TaxID=1173264 RepID=UPI0002ABDEA4|nr:hypothetical protein [Leptolyngbya sp. PCC 6406]
MERDQLAGLGAELRAQLRLLARVHQRLQDRLVLGLEGAAQMDSIAYQIHNLYCAAEDLLKLVATACENQVGSSGGWHRTLLLRMSEPVPGVRPALLSEELFDGMNRLRGFRHFVRHAYVTEIDPSQLRSNLTLALTLATELPLAVQRFMAELEGL